jgi:transcriptional regulator with XRE-family HTH domain
MDITSINARVKAVRKAKRLNQAEFGKAIGLRQVAISKLEQEGSTVTPKNILLICQKFHVSQQWLENGEGEMFLTGEPGIFAEFAKEYKLSLPEQQVAKYLLQLSHADREHILTHLGRIATAIQEGRRMEREELHRQAEKALGLADREQIHQQIEDGMNATEKGDTL